MRFRWIARIALTFALGVAALLAQRGFRQSRYEEVPMPPDAGEKTEWAFGRLRYPSGNYGRYWGGGSWTTDFPKADRQFVQGVRRLTRLHTRSVEQIVDPDAPDEIFHWPWIYAVEWATGASPTHNAKRSANICSAADSS